MHAEATTHNVLSTTYHVHVKSNSPCSMRVNYEIGWRKSKSEWICFEHLGYPLRKARAWWVKRSNEPIPKTTAEAVAIARAGGLAPTLSITVQAIPGQPYDRIIDYKLGPIPATKIDRSAILNQFSNRYHDSPPENDEADEGINVPW